MEVDIACSETNNLMNDQYIKSLELAVEELQEKLTKSIFQNEIFFPKWECAYSGDESCYVYRSKMYSFGSVYTSNNVWLSSILNIKLTRPGFIHGNVMEHESLENAKLRVENDFISYYENLVLQQE